MKKIYFFLFFTIFILGRSNISSGQMVGAKIFLQGHWLEIGMVANSSFGATAPPAGYHSHPAGPLGEVYDWGHDGWTVGTPAYMGDYTYPGSPQEGWAFQYGANLYNNAFQAGGYAGTGTLTGANTSYTNSGGRIVGNWAGSSGGVAINQQTRVDTAASWVVVTTLFTNTSAAAVTNIYYERTCDPDDDETWPGGSFITNNFISFQNDVDHRVEVSATGNAYPVAADYMGICTKDCRAKAYVVCVACGLVPITNLATIYAGTGGAAGYLYNVGTTRTDDIGIGVVWSLGTLAAGASTSISYAYVFSNANGVDSAFPEPTLVVNGVSIAPTGPAPAATIDTFNTCLFPGMTTLPVDLNFANDKDWTGSTWTWSPSTGLATTTGVVNSITINSLPPIITYTITGTNSAYCNARVMYLTVKTCNGATVNTPCLGDPLTFNAPGDSLGAIYSWYGPAPSTTVVGTTQSFTVTPSVWSDTGTYHVVKTVSGVSDTSVTVATILPNPTVPPPSTLCNGGTTTLAGTPAGGTWTSDNTAVATIGLTSGIVTGVSLGTANLTYTIGTGCKAYTSITIVSLSSIAGNTTICKGSTTTLNDAATGGTWVSGNTPVATINLTSGFVTGVTAGQAPITYTVPGGCITTTTVTVNPLDPITGTTSLCQRRASITLSDDVTGGTWSSGNTGLATITPATGIVSGVYPGTSSGGNVVMTYVNRFGCISTYTVTLNQIPSAPVVVSDTFCQYFNVTMIPPYSTTPFTVTPTTGLTWWGPGVTASYAGTPVPTTAVAGLDSYRVTQTSTLGCESDSALATSLVNPFPSTPLTHDTTYCQFTDQPATLVSMVSGYTGALNWYDINHIALASVDTPSTLIATYPDSLKWWVAQTINYGPKSCEGDSALVAVRIIPKPVFFIASQPWVCQFDSISLSYFSPVGSPLIDAAFLWSLPTGASVANGTSLTDSQIYVQFDSVNQNNYVHLLVTNVGGQCPTDTSILIDVVQLPTADAYSKADVCLSDTVTIALSSKSASATNFNWYIDNSPLFSSPAATIIASNSNSGGPYSISWTDTGLHIIHVQAFAEHGCTDKPSADTVDVRGLPDATFRITTKAGTLCLEDSVLFSANDSNYQNNYSWAPVHFFGDNNIDKHDAWGKVDETKSVVTLTITDPFGCIATSSRELDPSTCCSVIFPSSFSPNGDGHNDFFRPIQSTGGTHTYHKFVIQNRWGQTVFESSDNKASWDGTFNGVPQDIGVYYYYLKYDCGGNTLEEKGDVTLVR